MKISDLFEANRPPGNTIQSFEYDTERRRSLDKERSNSEVIYTFRTVRFGVQLLKTGITTSKRGFFGFTDNMTLDDDLSEASWGTFELDSIRYMFDASAIKSNNQFTKIEYSGEFFSKHPDLLKNTTGLTWHPDLMQFYKLNARALNRMANNQDWNLKTEIDEWTSSAQLIEHFAESIKFEEETVFKSPLKYVPGSMLAIRPRENRLIQNKVREIFESANVRIDDERVH